MGNYYNIFTKYENAIYERGENNYYVVKIKDIDNNGYVDPSTVSLTITDPCGVILVNGVSMASLSAGTYFHSYGILVNAVYGQYEVIVEVSSPTYTSIYKDKYYVLPWNIIYDVRRFSGITKKKSISDHDIAGVIWEAYKEILDTVYVSHYDDTLLCNPDDGKWIDGTNTTFAVKNAPIADFNGDGIVTGWGELSCGTDIQGWWKDSDGDCHRVNITVNEAHCGNITVTQLDGTAIPGNAKWVRLEYHSEWPTFNLVLFKYATAYLAAYKCIVRFKELDKATVADLHSNERRILASQKNRMDQEYKKTIRKIKKPPIEGAQFPGEQ